MRPDAFGARNALIASSQVSFTLPYHLLQHEPLHRSLLLWHSSSSSSSCCGCRRNGNLKARGVVSKAINLVDGDKVMGNPPVFFEPPRVASTAEALAVAMGASLTPEQQTAKQLQLPITLRIRKPAGIPTERQIMAQIQAASTWKELEAIVCQHSYPAAVGTAAAASSTISSGSDSPLAAAATEQPLFKSAQRQPPRRQPVKPLSVEPQAQISNSQDQQQRTKQPAPTTAPAVAAYDALKAVPKPSLILNHLHTTEAIRRLSQLLPQHPGSLNPADRARAAALIDFLTRQALALAQRLELDPRGVANVAAGLAKLGHKEQGVVCALQEAAVLQVEGFNAQEVAMMLGALVKLGARPDPQLLVAMQQHILRKLHLFKHQSIANTIWALAKLNTSTAGSNTAIASSSSSSNGGSSLRGGAFSAELVRSLVDRCSPQMHFWSCQHLAQAAWGLARLGAKPDTKWREALLLATYKCLRKMSPQDLANIIAALPELGAVPDQVWLDAFCITAAAKMRHTQPLGLCSILFGLAKVKQAQRTADRKAAKTRRQQQQQQQQQERPVSPATATAVQTAGNDSTAVHGKHGTEGAASLAQVKLLRAGLMWLQRLQHQLTAQQLAGVIMSLAELLPEHLEQQQQQQQHPNPVQQADADQQQQRRHMRSAVDQQFATETSHVQQQEVYHLQPGQQLNQGCEMQQKKLELLVMSRTLFEGWAVLMEQQQLTAGLTKKQAKLLGVAWGKLLQHVPIPA